MEDLSEIKRRADERDAFVEQLLAKAAEQEAAAKDRAMTRAFKGIMPAPERRKALAQADAR